jgi:hypothetical protein
MNRRPVKRARTSNRPWGFAARLTSLFALALTGCRVVNEATKLPAQAVTAVVPGTKSHPLDPALIQLEVERYSSDFGARTTAALDEYARRVGTPEARRQALRWKIAANSVAVNIASGPNPLANLLDFLAQATVMRTALEENWMQSTNSAAFQPWLEASRALETNAWKLADGILKPEQQRVAREAIRQWAESDAGAGMNLFVQPTAEFSTLIRQSGEKSEKSGNLFGLVGLDPTESLEPAVREVTRARLFAERAMFMAQRMPFLLRWQVELISDQLLGDEQVTTALNSIQRLSRAAESASQTAAQLPDRIAAERKAILAELDTQQGKLRELSDGVARALAAGEKMSTSLNGTLVTFDGLMKRFGVGEPSTNALANTDTPPFNILDYAHTAEKVAMMAKELDALMKDLGGTMDSPALQRQLQGVAAVSERAKADVKSVLNHAFGLGAGLVVLVFACALAYRRLLSSARDRSRAQTSGPGSAGK